MHGGTRSGAGRRTVHIDLIELEKLAALQCTDEELASWFGVSPTTIARRRRSPEFADAIYRGRARGRISVRRAQMKLLASGNPTMAVWLGRQLLGQRDVITTEHTGSGGEAIQLALRPDLSQLTDEELVQLQSIARKTVTGRRDRARTGPAAPR